MWHPSVSTQRTCYLNIFSPADAGIFVYRKALLLGQKARSRQVRIVSEFGSGSLMSVTVVCHNLILAKASDVTIQAAARRCSVFALEALRRDPAIMDICDCRPQGERRRKRARVEERDAT